MFLNIYRIALLSCAALALLSAGSSVMLWDTDLRAVILLPLAYLVFLSLAGHASWRSGPSAFLGFCQITAFLRYAVFPILAAIAGGYEGRSHIPPSTDAINLAAFLMCLEAVVVGFVINICERRYHRRWRKFKLIAAVPIPHWYLWCLLLLVVGMGLAMPASLSLVNFGVPSVLEDDIDIPAVVALTAMTIVSVKVFLFLRIIHSLNMLPRLRKIAPLLAGIACLFNASIFFGTNRMAVVLTSAASFYLLYGMFGRRMIAPLMGAFVGVVLLFAAITEERQYAQFSDSAIVNQADKIQSYVGGIYNVAIGLEVPIFFPQASDPLIFLFDILRPMAGFNIIVQSWDLSYSNIYFNNRMFTHIERRSQIMPMVAQGALFLPYFLAPLLPAIIVMIAYFLLNAAKRTSSLELRFAFIIMAMRIGFFWGQNTMNMINFFSLNVIIPSALIGAYILIKKISRHRRRSDSAWRVHGEQRRMRWQKNA